MHSIYSKPKDMISIFKEAKGGDGDGVKRNNTEDASQNKAHDSNNGSSEASTNGTANGDKSIAAAPSAKDAVAPKEGSATVGDAKTSTPAPTINGSSAPGGGPKKMSYAQMANASKAAAVST